MNSAVPPAAGSVIAASTSSLDSAESRMSSSLIASVMPIPRSTRTSLLTQHPTTPHKARTPPVSPPASRAPHPARPTRPQRPSTYPRPCASGAPKAVQCSATRHVARPRHRAPPPPHRGAKRWVPHRGARFYRLTKSDPQAVVPMSTSAVLRREAGARFVVLGGVLVVLGGFWVSE